MSKGRGSLVWGTIFVLPCLGLMLGCVMTPVDGQSLGGQYVSFDVTGYAAEPDAVVVTEALNKKTQQWELIGTGVTSKDVSIRAGLWTDSPPLYGFAMRGISIASASDPESLCRWDRECQPNDSSFARVRIRQVGGDPPLDGLLFGTDRRGWRCVFHHHPIRDLPTIGHECGFRDTLTVKLSP